MFFDFQVYVGCALTHAPIEFRKSIGIFRNKLKGISNVLEFYTKPELVGLVKENPAEIYHKDIHLCVGNCDLMVAVCDYPAIGLGWEIATQLEKRRKPVLALAHKNALVSNLVLGATSDESFQFQRYENLENNAFDMVFEKLSEMETVRSSQKLLEFEPAVA